MEKFVDNEGEVKSVIIYKGVELHLPFDIEKVSSEWAKEAALEQYYNYILVKKESDKRLAEICKQRWGSEYKND